MDFISQSEVTKEAVDYINSKLKEHISFTDVVGACESLKNAENCLYSSLSFITVWSIYFFTVP